MERKAVLKRRILLLTGGLAFLAGLSILSVYGIRKIIRDVHRRQLMETHVVIEIPGLRIKAPVLEGTDNAVLAEAVGHFPDTGAPGAGNYCIAGHSSTLYKEYFNALKQAEDGMQIILYDEQKHRYAYTVSGRQIVEPGATWILRDFGDDRLTLVTCTDDGTQRLVITAMLTDETEEGTE